MELWKKISFCDGKHEISNKGNIRVEFEGDIVNLKKIINPSGYLSVYLSSDSFKGSFLVHRLVAMHFLDNPMEKDTVNHIDANRQNNNASNLEWMTRAENANEMIERVHGGKSKDLKNRVRIAKRNLPKSGITSLFFFYFKDEYPKTKHLSNKLNNVLQTRITDKDMTEKLEQLVELLDK